MDLIFIVGIIIAIIGALTIAAVMWQGDARAPADRPTDVEGVAPPPEAEVTPSSPPPDDVIAASIAAAFSTRPVTVEEDAPLTIETITALYAHASDEVAVAEDAVQINVRNVLANQIEQLYAEYVRLGDERARLAETLFTNMLFEKIERSAGRLEIDTERETLNLRERFDKISADYNRAQFRLGSLQHLNTRLDDPRVAQQLDELVLEIRQLAEQARLALFPINGSWLRRHKIHIGRLRVAVAQVLRFHLHANPIERSPIGIDAQQPREEQGVRALELDRERGRRDIPAEIPPSRNGIP